MTKVKTNDEIEKKIAKVESLLFNYKKNKARLEILDEGLITDDDFVMGSFDYSSERVQTSNIVFKPMLSKDLTTTYDDYVYPTAGNGSEPAGGNAYQSPLCSSLGTPRHNPFPLP